MTSRARVFLVPLLLAAGCSLFTDPVRRPPEQLTALPRELTADEVRVSQAANQFTFTLFRRLSAAQPGVNVFVSPLSVTFSLGMAMNGAHGSTFDEMRSTLGFGAAELAEINEGYRGLMSLESGLDPSTTFTIANSVWYKTGLPVHQSFLDMVRETFDAEAKASPFDASTITQVNDWVRANTRDRIPTILDQIDPTDVMFLVNAIYFRGSWRDGFDRTRTVDAPFHALDGTTQTVKMMRREQGQGKIRYAYTGLGEVGEMSYGNGAFVMTVLLPRGDSDVNAAAAALDTATWRDLVGALHEIEGEVSLPRLRLEYERDLAMDLQALGMVTPFIPGGADFTRMSPLGLELFIGFVKHKTFVSVDEEGTEAAAVTNTGIRIISLPPGLRADRPFIFAIRERFSGTILFMGKIVRVVQ
jgi:serpin B